jgi:ribonucleoside-diphosphate reductase alpha chain
MIEYLDTEEILSNINIYSKYANYIPELERREIWEEVVLRNKNMHLEKFKDIPEVLLDIGKAYEFVLDKKILPSMRSLQFAGKSILKNPARLYNCAGVAMNDYRSFSEIMFLLLSGAGVGFSIQSHHIEQLGEVKKTNKSKRYLIADSIEGWADSVKVLMKSYLKGTPYPRFDYSQIRKKGTPVSSGGKAPGPGPLRECLVKIDNILQDKEDGIILKSIDVHDIVCHIADAVMSGGIRRAATISLFDFDDIDMRKAKAGDWWELNPQRGRANNSAVIMRSKIKEDEFKRFFKDIEYSGAGEPGIFFTNDKEVITNPCAEISLRLPYNGGAFCNLVEINGGSIKDQEDFNQRAKYASLIATLQASYTDFHYLRPAWKTQAEKEALIGVGLTGISDGKVLNLDKAQAAKYVLKENERISKLIGINKAYRTTTVKPSGNSSVVLKTSSGIHARHAPYYWRRMRINKSEPIYTYLSVHASKLLIDDIYDPENTSVISVVVKSNKDAIFRNENAINFLNRVKLVFSKWIVSGHRKGANYNNVSATCSVKDHEWNELFDWCWENKESFTGISFLPFDGGSYQQLPFEDATKKDYLEFITTIKDYKLDFKDIIELSDKTDLIGEVACGGGKCEII